MTTPATHHGRRGDLDTRADVHDLVVGFYREIVFDHLLAPVFTEIAEVDWSAHIPRLIDYWCRVLLGEPGYDGAIFNAHRDVHEVEPFRHEHFDQWYRLWVDSVDEHWAGPGAEAAKAHAARIGSVLSRRLTGTGWHPPDIDPPQVRTEVTAADAIHP